MFLSEKETQAQQFILDNEITTNEGLEMAEYFGGYNIDTYNKVIYSKTGMHSIEQFYNCARDEFYFSDEVLNTFELQG